MFRFLTAALTVATLLTSAPLMAADFPKKDIKVIVPFAPGGGVDVTVRMLSEVAPKYLGGKNIIVENMPGGGALIGQAAGAKARPDGYTMLAYTSSVVSNPIFKAAPFKHTDFTPVIMYCFDPEVLVVPANSPYKTLKDYLDASKKDRISMATPGHSTSHHMAALMAEKHFDTKFNYIHNSSSAQQVTQLLGGHVQSAMMAYGEVTSYLKDGSLRVLGMMSNSAYAGADKIERFSSLGFTTEWGAFRGLAVPAKTPADVVKKLSDAFVQMSADPAFVKRMEEAGFPLVVLNSEEFTKYANDNAKILLEMKPILQAK